MAKLPRWASSHKSTARTFFNGRIATDEQIQGLEDIIGISADYDKELLLDFSNPCLVFSEGMFSHDAAARHLSSLPRNTKVLKFSVSVATPSLSSLPIDASSVQVPVWAVIHNGKLARVLIHTGHGSIANYPGPRNKERFQKAVGMVSLRRHCHLYIP